MSDSELDDLFRESAAQSAPPDRREEIWEKLQEKLNEPSDKQKPLVWRRKALLVVFLLLFLGLVTWQLLRTNPGQSGRLPNFYVSQGEGMSAKQKTAPKQGSPAQEITGETAVHQPAKAQAEHHDPIRPPERQRPPSFNAVPAVPVAGMVSVSTGRKGSGRFELSLPALGNLPFVVSTVKNNLPEQMVIVDWARMTFKGSSTTMMTLPAKEHKIKTEDSVKSPVNPKTPHWYFGLTAGPDWSSASARGWGTGVGGGLMLTYRFHNKWGVRTGILLTKKIYDARPEDYNPKDNSWRGYDVKSIDANCSVIEVPVNIEYEIWSHGNDHIWLNTGLSSYWMHEEEYRYNYKNASGSWDSWSDEMYGQDHHLFSLLNFSAAYEKSWRHISLGIEPYVQMPLGGIGYGRVKLYSGGIRFSLQYGLK